MKKLLVFCLLIVSILSSVVVAFASSGFAGGSRGDGFSGGGFSTGTTATVVSYTALSQLCLQLNDDLAAGEFGDDLKSVSCNIELYSTGKWAICYHYRGSTYWYHNASGGLVYTTSIDSGDSSASGSDYKDYLYAINGNLINIRKWMTDGFSSVQSKLSSILSGVSGISEKVYSIMVYFFNLDNFITSRLIPYTDTLMTNTSHIDSYVSWIDDTTKSIDTRLSAVALNLDALQSSSDAIEEDTGLILEKVCGIYSQNDIIIAKLDDIKEIDSATLTLLKSYLASYQTSLDSITFAVSEVSKKTTSMDTTLTDFYSHMQSLDSFGGRIWTFLTNENGPIQAIAINAYYIREKLDNLTATCTHDDTDILAALGRIENNFGDINTTLGDLNVTTDFTDTNIVAAVNNLASLFSLGETQTIGVGDRDSFDKSWDVTSVKFAGVTPDGFVVFSPAESTFLSGNFSLPQLSSNGYWCASWYEVVSACTALTFSVYDGSGSTNISGTVTLFDASGSVIALAVGDRIQPTATLYQWEVVRQNGQVVPIVSSKFTYDTAGMDGVFSSFGELLPPVIMVSAADLIAMPSLFSSSYRQIASLYEDFRVVVCNCSNSALTVEYVNPSSLLNWYANRQNDFRYWLDTKLNSLPVGAPADLTSITTRMDTIIDLLQNTSGDAACEHTYKQDMTTDATCTLPGLLVSTCSKCGDSYSEIVDPLGHDWKCTDHVAAVTDPETGEETAAAYDIYTCSRCGDTYNDYSGEGAPEDYSNTSISRLIVELFSRLGKLVGSLMAFVVNAFDKALTSVDNIISKFNSYTEQITGFGGTYPAWLGGLWGILPADLQVALTFAVVCMAVALVGKKLVFS